MAYLHEAGYDLNTTDMTKTSLTMDGDTIDSGSQGQSVLINTTAITASEVG
jgi:hypothetical protein